MLPTPQRVRRQRRGLAATAVFFTCMGLAFLAIAAVSWFGAFLWMVFVGR